MAAYIFNDGDRIVANVDARNALPKFDGMKVTVNDAEVATVPFPVVMDKAFGNAGENGTAGTILSSNRKSSNWGRGDDLRAFLFWDLLNSLRKAFKGMDKLPVSAL